MQTWTYLSSSETATEALGRALAGALERESKANGGAGAASGESGSKDARGGWVIALVGPLGAGKTRLVQAIATALGVDRRDVSSPTFVLVHEYPGRLAVYHFDAYRLPSAEEFLELGSEEYFSRPGVCLVEWADRVAACLPDDRLEIALEIAGPEKRRVRLRAVGSDYERLLGRAADALGR